MYFTENAVTEMKLELRSVADKQRALRERYLVHNFRENRAGEFARHGFTRRLTSIVRSVENVFSLIAPECVEPPSRDVRADAEINIQGSIFNTFGAIDNLAWIWVVEKSVRRGDGSELPDTWVGLRRKNTTVRQSLPTSLREHLDSIEDWFGLLENYRHALAHRIPLYIPPYCVDPKQQETHAELETLEIEAIRSGADDEYERLVAERKQLEFFRPWMQHSFGESARPLVFHPQLLANFNTIEEIGKMFIDELES